MTLFSLPRMGLALAAAAVAAATLAVSGPALAAPSFKFGPTTPNVDQSNWGGYVATGSFGKIVGSWVEPSVTCTSSNNLFAPWVGIDGYGSQTVEQTGVQASCSSGRPVYSAWYEMYPRNPVYWSSPVSAGDHFTGTVVSNGGGSYTITLKDVTKGWTKTTHQSLAGTQDASAEAVIESPTQSYPRFSSLTFSGIRVDGQLFSNFSPTPLDSGGYVPGPLSGGTFTITRGGPRPVSPAGTGAQRHSVIRY